MILSLDRLSVYGLGILDFRYAFGVIISAETVRASVQKRFPPLVSGIGNIVCQPGIIVIPGRYADALADHGCSDTDHG